MMYIQYSVYLAGLILIFRGVSLATPLYMPEEFPYTKCKQDSGNVTCKALKISKERREKQSVWPPGPYALRMTEYGCPETMSRGWTKGNIKSLHGTETWTLYFCVKLRRDQNLDKGAWIPGNYYVYMSGLSCPEGFRSFERTRPMSKLNVYGHVPKFKLGLNNITFSLCARDSTSITEDSEKTPVFGMLDTYFMLEKEEHNDCPKTIRMTKLKEHENKYCTNKPICTGDQTRELSLFHVSIGQDLQLGKNNVWCQIDLMRSLPVSVVEIRNVEIAYTLYSCYIADSRWSFQHRDALMCRKLGVVSGQEVSTLCFRNVVGRYITVTFTTKVEITLGPKAVSVYIDNLKKAYGELCNEYLGLKDGTIRDFQISASSMRRWSDPHFARPKVSGWCASKNDANPWILIDLTAATIVEGVTIWDKRSNRRNGWSFDLHYGMEKEKLDIYNQTLFHVHLDKQRLEGQTFMLPQPVSARYIKLQVLIGVSMKSICLSLEIQGCKLSGPDRLLPRLRYHNGEITTNLQHIKTTSTITTIGYPFPFGSDQQYTWLITFPEQRYITIIFTDLYIGLPEISHGFYTRSFCGSLFISKKIGSTSEGKTIDHQFDGRKFVVETGESLLFLTFTSCHFEESITSTGFYAIVSEKEIPACLSVDKPWTKQRRETCNRPKMVITSMSILNFPFKKEERWDIYVGNHNSIQVEFEMFYVSCPHKDVSTKFKIIDSPDELTYCNTNMPPSIFYSKNSNVTVMFHRFDQSRDNLVTIEGFRLSYSSISHSLKNLTDLREPTTKFGTATFAAVDKVCSKTFKKCYYIVSSKMTWLKAGLMCLQQNTKLVSIPSKNELKYIHYLLRDITYREMKHSKGGAKKGSRFRAHIGLMRLTEKDGRKKYVWSNNSPMTFSAWSLGSPKDGDCTRTNFRHVNSENTWESEDCSDGLAKYFICEKQMDTEKDEVRKHDVCGIASLRNHPNVNVTYSGKICQNWNALTVDAASRVLTRSPKGLLPSTVSNFCQEETSLGILLCYTTDPNTLWEPCFLQEFTRDGTQINEVYTGNISYSQFKCDNATVVPTVYRCDGKFDCVDLTDELLCPNVVKDHMLVVTENIRSFQKLPANLEFGSYYLCGSTEWISVIAKCDGVIDCLDASDEVNCTRSQGECKENEFSCADGSCIHASQVCDFISDCTNSNDEMCEFKPCAIEEYLCNNKQCIPIDKRCNGIPDCIDKSDETLCASCTQDSFHCDGNKCIQKRLRCDKFPDCNDRSDEISCHLDPVSSCDEWWEMGYHLSGQYMIDGIDVFCDFSSVDTANGTIELDIRNVDMDDMRLYTWSSVDRRRLYYPKHRSEFTDLINRNGYTCMLKVKLASHFPEREASCSKNLNRSSDFPFCGCIVDYYKMNSSIFGRRRRQAKMGTSYEFERVMAKECFHGPISPSYFTEKTHVAVGPMLMDLVPFPFDLNVGPFTCSYGYTPLLKQEDPIHCKEEDNIIPKSMLCVYDVDAAGYRLGCRFGGHLQNCDNFTCPKNTVKCPESYCIPLRFVCDGIVQCPTGQDETDCFCTDSGREILILTEDTLHPSDSKTAAIMLARKFITNGSIIRILYYKSRRLEDIPQQNKLLEIREEYIYPFESSNYMHKCHYKTTARNVLHSIRFSSKGNNGLVFIEDSETSSEVAEIMMSNISNPEFTIYRITKNIKSPHRKYDHYRHVKDVQINKWSSLSSTGYKRFPEICKAEFQVPCSGAYRCSSSKQCIPLEQVCDGIVQCRNADDERLCAFMCPEKCKCDGQVINCRSVGFDELDFRNVSVNTRSLDTSQNPGLQNISRQHSLSFPFMLKLNLSFCKIKEVNGSAFSHLYNIRSLDLGYNQIAELPDKVFSNLFLLNYLNLDGNFELNVISPSAFHGMRSIRNLRISGTKLKHISAFTFSGLTLESIDISNNEIQEIEENAFSNISVLSIDFTDNDIFKFNELIFKNVTSLQRLHTPAFKFCCIRPCYLAENNCFPTRNEFSSCKDLMRHPVLQAALWLVGIASLFGNFGSIMYRLTYDRERMKIGYGIFVTNLAAADFLMGVYLIMIATVDSLYRNRYIFMDDQWRNSRWCVTAGVLSTISSEASVLFLCLITLDRLLVIKYPFGTIRFEPKKAHLCCGISWIISIILALIPVLHATYFQNQFYSRSGVCIALPLTRDKLPGWMYSVLIFVGLNFCSFILVAFGQLSIFLELRKATIGMKKTQSSRRRDLRVAKNLILVATTDFLCWFPIGVMGIMALTGYPIPGDVYAWTVVFILPLNSAMNPVLYTLSAIVGQKSFNPSTEEQIRVETQTEIGSALLQYKCLSRCVRTKSEIMRVGKIKTLRDILREEKSISVDTATAVAIHLAKYLCILHESSISLKKMEDTNTYLRINKNKKHQVKVVIDTKTTLASDKRQIHDNIYQYGQLLKKMVASCKKTK